MMKQCNIDLLRTELVNDILLMKVFSSLTSPKSAKMISEETRISISTVYRKLKKLKKKKLVSVSGEITDSGIKNFLYTKL